MALCTHVQWLGLIQDQSTVSLHYSNRLRYIAESLPRASKQYPSTLLFIGKASKSAALRCIYRGSRISSYRNRGVANISLDPKTANDSYPVFIANASPDGVTAIDSLGTAKCHETTCQLLDWSRSFDAPPQLQNIKDLIHARLLLMFTDVICIFADDCGGLDGVMTKLITWARLNSASSLPVRPRVLVVARLPGEIFDLEVLHFRSQLFLASNFSSCFSSVNVINSLVKLRTSSKAQFSALEWVLAQETAAARQARATSYTLFSSIHLAALFDKAWQRFAKFPNASFNFIRSSREGNAVNYESRGHIEAFLRLSLESKLPNNIAIPFISSAITLDSFPPEMHLFDPSHVFYTLYRPHVLQGLQKFTALENLSSELVCNDIETAVTKLFLEIRSDRRSAKDIRKEVLCQSISFQGRVMPPTCRARVVSFDGGGCRGIVSLAYFDALQDAVGVDYPLQEHFDFGIGTSSGAIGLAALFVVYMDTKTSLRFWHKFATHVFQKFRRRSIFAKLWWFFISYFTDSQYDADLLEDALQEVVGFRLLFGPTGSRTSGMKIAITATTISNATLCLFSNYSVNADANDTYCKHIRPSDASNEILLWEALRCTTAAPWYYKPKFLEAFGTFQDGGLRNNNPIKPGRREVKHIWKNGECDIVLSIGTGFKEELTSPGAPNVRNLFQDGALARLYRASMSSLSLDSSNSWKDYWYGLEEDIKGQHFRLDVPLKGKVPDIDEIDEMSSLQDQVGNNLGDLKGLDRALKAASFFFELDELPVHEGFIYRCHGSILSRSPNSRALVQKLIATYDSPQFITSTEVSLGFLSLNDICDECGRFQKTVTISVRHPSDVINLHLRYSRLFQRSISGFPNSIQWFEDRQNLRATFGRADHNNGINQAGFNCSCVLRRRRMVAASELAPGKRRASDPLDLRRSKRLCR
ncbi:hypothetical protein V496_00161 [Pseudogymnoascus sp. VKM F-4515 (FW-2607)]|nr:hypothetical protein V496_00161 [Pseudogymnoascus sp. VKM F-4515 (FW-2607)]